MKPIFALVSLLTFVAANASATGLKTRVVRHELGGVQFVNKLIYNPKAGPEQIGLLMVPNWMGPSANADAKAAKLARMGYTVFVADVYGTDTRPQTTGEAGKAAGALRAGDRQLLRDRVTKALAVFRELAGKGPHSREKIAAIGFCFGGGTVLELARSGIDIAAVVSFHGNLDSPRPAKAGELKARVLALHGADDPYVTPTQVSAFKEEMQAAAKDWQLVEFGGTVHSFTNPEADRDGARYNARSCRRAFEYMEELLEETFGDDDDD